MQNQQDENGAYGEGHATAVILHSLRLIGYPVEKGADVLTSGIIKNDIGSMPGGRVGSYILGAMATCQDPHHVNQSKLIRALKTKLDKYPHLGFNHPFQYSWAVMALCSTGIDLGKKKFAYAKKVMESSKQRLDREEGCSGDTLHMQVLALTCVEKTLKKNDSRWLKEKIRGAIKRASDRIAKSQMNDSTFGENVVTAALASQVIRGKGGICPGVVHSIKREKNILGVRGVGILDGVGEGKERKEGSFSPFAVSSFRFSPPLIP